MWTAVEPFQPSPGTAAEATPATKLKSWTAGSSDQDNVYLTKMKLKLVEDSMKNIPFLADTYPENILKFLMALKRVYDLNLVMDFEFLSLQVSRTSGRMTQLLGAHLNSTQSWGMVRSEVISTFFSSGEVEIFRPICSRLLLIFIGRFEYLYHGGGDGRQSFRI